MPVCGKKVEKMWRREKVWDGVPRCPTVFLGVPVFLRCSSVLLVDLRCLWEFLGVPGCPTLLVGVPRISSLSYGVSCGFFVFLCCSYGVPRGFSLSYVDPRFNRGFSLFFGVPLRYPFSYVVLLQCSSLLYGVPLGSSLFFFFPRGSFGFLVFYNVLRVSLLFSSGFRCS